jgi:hypothetical protein
MYTPLKPAKSRSGVTWPAHNDLRHLTSDNCSTACQQTNNEDHQKHEEEYLRYARSARRYPAKSKNGGDNRNY